VVVLPIPQRCRFT